MKFKDTRLVQFILKKVYKRPLLPLLRKNEIKEVPQLISRVIEARKDGNEFEVMLQVVRQQPCLIILYKSIEAYKGMHIEHFNKFMM